MIIDPWAGALACPTRWPIIMRLVDRQGRPTTLFVSTLSPSTGKPTVTLRVDKPDAYSICSVKVIRAPKDLHYLGRTFVNLAEAVGDLKQAGCIPDRTSGSLFYLNDFKAYIVGSFDNSSVEKLRYYEGRDELHILHSPKLADVRVACLEGPEEGQEGRWVSVGALRPFIPADMPSADVPGTVQSLLRQVCNLPQTENVPPPCHSRHSPFDEPFRRVSWIVGP